MITGFPEIVQPAATAWNGPYLYCRGCTSSPPLRQRCWHPLPWRVPKSHAKGAEAASAVASGPFSIAAQWLEARVPCPPVTRHRRTHLCTKQSWPPSPAFHEARYQRTSAIGSPTRISRFWLASCNGELLIERGCKRPAPERHRYPGPRGETCGRARSSASQPLRLPDGGMFHTEGNMAGGTGRTTLEIDLTECA